MMLIRVFERSRLQNYIISFLIDGVMLVSVIVTIKNEREHITHLLDSLLVQESPF